MILLSYNVRGVGNVAKRKVIREVVCRNHVEFLCLQETKLQNIDRRLCAQLWGDSDFDWKAVAAENRGRCVIVNVYAPCTAVEKRALWENIIAWRQTCPEDAWCLAGDFNAVRSEAERRGCTGTVSSQRREMLDFNDFIDSLEMLDIPLAGRKFTWRRLNNQAQSRIDRFFISAGWNVLWANCSQVVLNRDISDHCPLLMKQCFQNWGPKPFRVLNCWLQDPRLSAVVDSTWKGLSVNGWGAFALKEKLKGLKGSLKQWNKDVFGDLKFRREVAVQKINDLDVKEEEGGLTHEEVELRKVLLNEFWAVLKFHESLLCQKARSKWVAEGDQNTSFFHSTINWKRRANSSGFDDR
ncbi:uncharacterized protein LOC130712829 [Lotus japonicus]|uniref:uncharacterized protein LOC130712829 n=1 Tax=Lotus japonicus TaxID=34305 RepID=UPI00258C8575|nr:uncharacterized protein LOC130712829 [Lotus japonicus]